MSRARRQAFACLAIVAALCAVTSPAHAALSDVPTPTVSGPVPVTSTSHPFMASDLDLADYGYVEKEYYVTGNAFTYSGTTGLTTGTKVTTGGPNNDGAFPYKTR